MLKVSEIKGNIPDKLVHMHVKEIGIGQSRVRSGTIMKLSLNQSSSIWILEYPQDKLGFGYNRLKSGMERWNAVVSVVF